MLLVEEAGTRYLYIAGSGQANGGGSVANVSKYAMDGTRIWWRTLGDESYGKTSSGKVCNSIINGKIYVAGLQKGTWNGDTGSIGYVWIRDPNGVALSPIMYQETGKGTAFQDCCFDGQYLYAVGHINPGLSGGRDVLVTKYLPDGTLIWQKTWGGTSDETAQAVLEKDDFLYVTGQTVSFGSGQEDVFLLQISANDGTIRNQTISGGNLTDVPLDITANGNYVFTQGYTTSVSDNGNTPGKYEGMLLSYLLPYCNIPPVGDLNNDCKVNLGDFSLFAENWLKCNVEPSEACLY